MCLRSKPSQRKCTSSLLVQFLQMAESANGLGGGGPVKENLLHMELLMTQERLVLTVQDVTYKANFQKRVWITLAVASLRRSQGKRMHNAT
mmetsp:Transcript_124748/g.216290  ORF Transcript_124748/g.216290 Transcript_124748/m.216290 type:complete len:91 (+) Transcript_124748:926-1198(+)